MPLFIETLNIVKHQGPQQHHPTKERDLTKLTELFISERREGVSRALALAPLHLSGSRVMLSFCFVFVF